MSLTVELKEPGKKAVQVPITTIRKAVQVVDEFLVNHPHIGWNEWTLFVGGGGGGKVRVNGRVKFYVNTPEFLDRKLG